jgi:hypothetical protein
MSYIPHSNGASRYENGFQDNSSKSYGNGTSGSLSKFGSLDSSIPKTSGKISLSFTFLCFYFFGKNVLSVFYFQ